MNCQEIKNRLAEKDKQIENRKIKTIEYFNLVKDEVVDRLIEDHIDGEFESEFYYINEEKVMELLYSKLGVNTKHIHWRYPVSLGIDYWRGNGYINLHNSMTFEDEDQDIEKSKNHCCEINESFNYGDFGKLLISYIISKGFKQDVYKRHNGDIWYFNKFKITRSRLENNCCDIENGVEFNLEDHVENKDIAPIEKDQVFNPFQALIGLVVLFVIFIIVWNLK